LSIEPLIDRGDEDTGCNKRDCPVSHTSYRGTIHKIHCQLSSLRLLQMKVGEILLLIRFVLLLMCLLNACSMMSVVLFPWFNCSIQILSVMEYNFYYIISTVYCLLSTVVVNTYHVNYITKQWSHLNTNLNCVKYARYVRYIL
jgi:hypothetical protein